MPTFEYTVRGQDGKLMKGTSEAENERTLAARLQEQGYLPVKVKKVRGAKAARAASGGQTEVTSSIRRRKRGGFVFGGVEAEGPLHLRAPVRHDDPNAGVVGALPLRSARTDRERP